MNTNLNSSPKTLSKNSFIDIKSTNDEIQDDITSFFGQKNESVYLPNDEDSNFIFPDFENTINDFSVESGHSSKQTYEKSKIERQLPSINYSNMSIDENLSIDKSSLSFIQSKDASYLNDINEFRFLLNIPKLYEEDEKFSGSDSFLSNLELPNQEFINSEINDYNLNLIDEEGKRDKIDINVRESINEIKDKNHSIKYDLIEEKKKSKINFLVSKKNEENNNLLNDKNEYINKKRSNKNEEQQHKNNTKNIKLNLLEINKATVINPKAYKCECGKIFSTEENQRLHYLNIHLHEKPYNCSFCGEGFSHRNGKIYHERVYHTFIFPYPCKECSSAFASKSAMIYHMKSKHKVL